ncbi:rod shape-determining protein RodA [Nocardioides aurantiacus]|uniref:rod shape-determining protein RodA n=1 Tax=Nocardioides aurantiacus TaxID=86796 RepID=UPI00403F21D5
MTALPLNRLSVARSRVVVPPLDWVLVGCAALIMTMGTLLVWSATATNDVLTGGDSTAYLHKHLVNVVIGLVLAAVVMATDHRWVRIVTPLVYAGSVIGLLLVLVMGTTINGSRSWLMIGGLSIQPAEFAKLAVVIGMAMIVAERTENSRQRRVGLVDVALMGAVAGLPAVLIMAQPDLGTMLVLTATVFGVLAVAGVPRRWLVGLLASGVALVTLVVAAGVLKSYQVNRFIAFIYPDLDPRGAGYNTTQARIAIGNGGLFGQGLFDGSQTRSRFVPEQHTDFIFTVAGEELGLVGAGLLIVLFAVLLWRALLIARHAEDMFGRVAAAGIACWFAFQAFQNIGMCLGIMPVTGVPLPLVSYGGSSMFATMMAIGLLVNIGMRGTGTGRPGFGVRPRGR